MEPWIWLTASLGVSVVGGVVKLLAFKDECRLRSEVEQRSISLLEQAQLTGDAQDVRAMGTALARTIAARGPLPVFRRHPAVAVTEAKKARSPSTPTASLPALDEDGPGSQ